MPINGIGVYAHRGAKRTSPENTLEAFHRARREGVDGIECDVRLSADGEPILFHDADGSRLLGRAAPIRSLRWSELRSLRLSGGQRIPHLDEAFDLMSAWKAELFLDLHEDRLDLVEAVVRRLPAEIKDRTFLLDFYGKRKLLLHARALDPEVRIAVMPGLPWRLRASADIGAASLCVGWDGPWTRLGYRAACALHDVRGEIARLIKDGVPVSGGIANTPLDIAYFLAQGVSGIWTDDLALAQGFLVGAPSRM